MQNPNPSDPNEITSKTTDLSHWFLNPDSETRSYTVSLKAFYGTVPVEAPGLTVAVPGLWMRLVALFRYILDNFGAWASALGAVISAWSVWQKLHKEESEPEAVPGRQYSRVRRWPWKRTVAFLIFTAFFFFFAANRFGRVITDPVRIEVGQIPTLPSPMPVNLQPYSWFPTVLITLLIVAILIGAFAFARSFLPGGWRSAVSIWSGGDKSDSSLSARLREIQRFAATGEFSKRQMRPFYRALFKELRKKHDVEKEQRRLSGTFKKLIDKLVVATQKGSQEWYPERKSKTAAPESPVPMDLPHRAAPSRFFTSIDAFTNLATEDLVQIEVSEVNDSIRLDIVDHEGEVMQSLNADSFDLDQETRDQIRRLYGLARDAGLKIEKTLKDVISNLDKDIAAETDS